MLQILSGVLKADYWSLVSWLGLSERLIDHEMVVIISCVEVTQLPTQVRGVLVVSRDVRHGVPLRLVPLA